MTAAAGGLDVLVLTGGVASADSDKDVSAAGSRARTVVVTAREDLQIAAETRTVLTVGT